MVELNHCLSHGPGSTTKELPITDLDPLSIFISIHFDTYQSVPKYNHIFIQYYCTNGPYSDQSDTS